MREKCRNDDDYLLYLIISIEITSSTSIIFIIIFSLAFPNFRGLWSIYCKMPNLPLASFSFNPDFPKFFVTDFFRNIFYKLFL